MKQGEIKFQVRKACFFVFILLLAGSDMSAVHADENSTFSGEITGITEKKVFFYAEITPVAGETILVKRSGKVIARLKVTGVDGNTVETVIAEQNGELDFDDELAKEEIKKEEKKEGTNDTKTNSPVTMENLAKSVAIIASDVKALKKEVAKINSGVIASLSVDSNDSSEFNTQAVYSKPSEDEMVGKAVMDSSKPRLAVVGFASPGVNISSAEIQNYLIGRVEVEIAKTGRFSLVNRT